MADEEASHAAKRLRAAEHDGSCAVRSAEGDVMRWPREAALRAGTLKNWIDETGGAGTFPTPLPAEALQLLRDACAHDGGEATSPIISLPVDGMPALLHAALKGAAAVEVAVLLVSKGADRTVADTTATPPRTSGWRTCCCTTSGRRRRGRARRRSSGRRTARGWRRCGRRGGS